MKNITYYNAGAGSGKTFKLTSLLVEKIQDKGNPVNPSEVILTTFTELAAAEFKEKAREALLEANLLDNGIGQRRHRDGAFRRDEYDKKILVSARHQPAGECYV